MVNGYVPNWRYGKGVTFIINQSNSKGNLWVSTDDLPLMLTVDNLASVLDIGRNTAYDLVRSDQIKSVRIGRQFRIPKDALLQFMNICH